MAKFNIRSGNAWLDACTADIRIRDSNGNWVRVGAGSRVWVNDDWQVIQCNIDAWAAPLIDGTGPFTTYLMWQIRLSSPLSTDATIPIQIKRTDTGQTNTYYPKVPAGQLSVTVTQNDGSSLRTGYVHPTNGTTYKVEAILYTGPAYNLEHDKKFCRYTIPMSGQYSSGAPVYSLT